MWDFEHGDPAQGVGAPISISPTPFLPPARALWPRARPTSALFRRPPTRPRPTSSLFPTSPLRRGARCGRFFWSARCRVDRVRTVALDTSSLTSVALTKILFAKWLGGAREPTPAMAPDLEAMLAACDAALLIGDPALQIDRDALRHARPRGGVARAHRQVVRVRVLGDSTAGPGRTRPSRPSPKCLRIRAITASCARKS